MTPARSWTRSSRASVRRLRLVVVCTRVRRWGSRSVRCCMRARIREARSAGRVCGSCIYTCVAAPVPLFPFPSLSIFQSSFSSLSSLIVLCWFICRVVPTFPFAELFLFLIFDFDFDFLCVILSIVLHLYAVRGVEGDLFRSRTEHGRIRVV